MALMLAVTTACEIKPQKTYDYEPPADKVQERDSVIFGICGGQSTQNVLQIIKDNEDTLFFNVEEARKKGMVMADYHRGEEIYVLPDSTGKVVYSSEYSAFSYILNCMQKSTDAKLLNMVKSMVIYNQTAKLYFGN